MTEVPNPYQPPQENDTAQPPTTSLVAGMSPPRKEEMRGGKKKLTPAQNLAQASWGSLVLIMFVSMMTQHPEDPKFERLIGALLIFVFTLLGFAAGVIALVVRRGQERVRTPALVGTVLTGGLLLLWTATVLVGK